MKKKSIIAIFGATFFVCAIYGGLRYTVSSGTGQATMADTLEEENSMGDTVSGFLRVEELIRGDAFLCQGDAQGVVFSPQGDA